MFKNLRKKLTLLYTITTGVILTLVVIGVIVINSQESAKKNLNAFQTISNTIITKLQFDNSISQSWLSQMEFGSNLIIHIEDNKVPFLYKGSWNPKTARNILIERAKQIALKENINTQTAPVSASSIKSSIFTITGDYSDQYYATVSIIGSKKEFKTITLLGYIPPNSSSLYQNRYFLILLDVLGILALFTVSWFFVGSSLKPIEQNRQKQTEFIAAASHELRSPLAVMRSSVSAIKVAPDQQKHLLENIEKECIRMSRLVNDMLLLASTDAKNWTLHLSEVNLDTILIDTFELFEPLCKEKKQTLLLDLPNAAFPSFVADKERLIQILTILLDNAIYYTPEHKKITLKAYSKQSNFTIEVIDQGCGISDSSKKHVFDRFYMGDQSRSDKRHFGLGLSIAKELVTLHHGIIKINDSPDGGALFSISFPKNLPKI